MTFQFSNKPDGNCFILLVRHSKFKIMTRSEAYRQMKFLGKRVTHNDFLKHEYLEWKDNQIKTEDGYDFSSQFHSLERLQDGWSLYCT
jgi:hypothetical protein